MMILIIIIIIIITKNCLQKTGLQNLYLTEKKKSNATMTHKLRPTNKKEKGRKNWGNKETLIPDDPSSRTIFELCILL